MDTARIVTELFLLLPLNTMRAYLRVICTGYAVLSLRKGIELCRHFINKFSPLICDQDVGTSVTKHYLFDNSMLVNKTACMYVLHSCSIPIIESVDSISRDIRNTLQKAKNLRAGKLVKFLTLTNLLGKANVSIHVGVKTYHGVLVATGLSLFGADFLQ